MSPTVPTATLANQTRKHVPAAVWAVIDNLLHGGAVFAAAEVSVSGCTTGALHQDIPLENFDRVLECVPDARAPLLHNLLRDQNFFDAHVEVLRDLLRGLPCDTRHNVPIQLRSILVGRDNAPPCLPNPVHRAPPNAS